MDNKLRIYVLYPFLGSFSVEAVNDPGRSLSISATSVRQAYALAHGDHWICANDPTPIGIVSAYSCVRGTKLWCGCSGQNVTGGHVSRGDGIRAVRKAIAAHDCPRPVNDPYEDLRSRLRRYRQQHSETERPS